MTRFSQLRGNSRLHLKISLSIALLISSQLSFAAMYEITQLGSSISDFLPIAINDSGQVVGQRRSSPGVAESGLLGLLYDSGTIHDLGSLGGGSFPRDVNDLGQVVGLSYNEDDQPRAFLYERGSMQNLGTLNGGLTSSAESINNSGQVVGWSSSHHQSRNPIEKHAFLYDNGDMKGLGTLEGYDFSHPTAINDSGQVVGTSYYYNPNTERVTSRAFLYKNGSMQDLGTLGGRSIAYDINDSGQVVGSSVNEDNQARAFLYENDSMRDLGTLGGSTSFADGINDSGWVVGSAFDTTSQNAFIYKNGNMIDLNKSDLYGEDITTWTRFIRAYDINNQGQIIGSGYKNIDSTLIPFLLTPIGDRADNPLMPLSIAEDGSFEFSFTPDAGEMVFIDPEISVGYDYAITAGDNTITSVMLPLLAGDTDGYQLYALGDTSQTGFLGSVLGGGTFDFTDSLTGFTVLDIDTAAMLDPTDPTAFVTGLTFANANTVSISQTPITQAVPEPETYAMLLAGLGLIGFKRKVS